MNLLANPIFWEPGIRHVTSLGPYLLSSKMKSWEGRSTKVVLHVSKEMEYKYIPRSSNSLFQPFWTGWVKDCRQDLNKSVKGKIAVKTVSWNGRYGQDVSGKKRS